MRDIVDDAFRMIDDALAEGHSGELEDVLNEYAVPNPGDDAMDMIAVLVSLVATAVKRADDPAALLAGLRDYAMEMALMQDAGLLDADPEQGEDL
jgi:hypothetical protein